MNNQLTTLEKSRLSECESIIEKSMSSFYDMGIALREIRELKLYKEEYSTFDEYCVAKWSIKKDYANKVIGSSDVIDNLNTIVSVLPKSEGQTRPLTKLKDPEIQKQAWHDVVKESEETHAPITAKKVEEVVGRYCNPCVNPAIEFRRVFYLTPFYDKKLKELMRGEKESTYLRRVIEKHCDENAA